MDVLALKHYPLSFLYLLRMFHSILCTVVYCKKFLFLCVRKHISWANSVLGKTLQYVSNWNQLSMEMCFDISRIQLLVLRSFLQKGKIDETSFIFYCINWTLMNFFRKARNNILLCVKWVCDFCYSCSVPLREVHWFIVYGQN